MGRPAPHDESCPGVQQHDEARGESSHNAASIGTDSQAADEPSANPAGQAKLVLQEKVQLLGDKTKEDLALRGQETMGSWNHHSWLWARRDPIIKHTDGGGWIAEGWIPYL